MAIKFKGVDFLEIDSLLSDDERLVRDNTRLFIEENLIPIIEECNREGRFPKELIKPMGELGFYGASLHGYGCAGMSAVEYGLMTQELERGDSGVRSFVSVQSGPVHVSHPRLRQRRAETEIPAQDGARRNPRLLRPHRARRRLQPRSHAHARQERRRPATSSTAKKCGSPPAPSPTSPSSGPRSTDEDDRIRGFIVPTDTPGFKAADVHGKWSLRASVTSSLSLQDVRIPADCLLPGSKGLGSPLSCLNQARYGIAWGAIGAAMACYDCALQYAQFRKQFHDMPIAGHQLVQEKLVWMISEITKAQLLALQVGRLKDAGKVKPYHISMAKRNNVWMALECARMGRDILGGNGIADEYPIFRHMANLESVKTYEGTHDIHTLIIGEHITGIAAF